MTMPIPISAPGVRRVAVLGAGSWGTTFSKVLADGGSDVALWSRRAELAREISQSKRNSDYLPGINLPRNLWSSALLPDVLDGAEIVFLSVPSQSLRENLRIVRELIPADAVVVSLMKGIERGSALRMSQVIEQELRIGEERVAVISGPNLALEIMKLFRRFSDVGVTVVVATHDLHVVREFGQRELVIEAGAIHGDAGGHLPSVIAVR